MTAALSSPWILSHYLNILNVDIDKQTSNLCRRDSVQAAQVRRSLEAQVKENLERSKPYPMETLVRNRNLGGKIVQVLQVWDNENLLLINDTDVSIYCSLCQYI